MNYLQCLPSFIDFFLFLEQVFNLIKKKKSFGKGAEVRVVTEQLCFLPGAVPRAFIRIHLICVELP